ncbi:hypothetical protein [Denitromonas sp.]|uniref:hypothetical protein n=1 Tax=Denitromonas sp. TaxID=2734609 RepID=UPI003A890529
MIPDTLINRIRAAVLRLRYRAAAADLAWLKARAPECIAEQQQRVDTLERELHRIDYRIPDRTLSVEEIRRDVERRAKWGGVA